MKETIKALILALGLATAGVTPALSADKAAECPRGCLLDHMDRYLQALTGHDASILPIAPGALIYENGQPANLKDGIWNSVNIVANRATFVDPKAGQAAFFGSLKEKSGETVLYFARLKIDKNKITEIEQLTTRKGKLLFNPSGVQYPKAIWFDIVPPEERVPAQELVRIANSYFESLQVHDPNITALHPDCDRIENGTETTNTTRAEAITSDSCETGISKLGWITKVRERRFPIVDAQRGLVIGMSHLDISAGVGSLDGPKTDKPFSFIIYEVFKIVDGRILDIECIMTNDAFGVSYWPKGPFYENEHPFTKIARKP